MVLLRQQAWNSLPSPIGDWFAVEVTLKRVMAVIILFPMAGSPGKPLEEKQRFARLSGMFP